MSLHLKKIKPRAPPQKGGALGLDYCGGKRAFCYSGPGSKQPVAPVGRALDSHAPRGTKNLLEKSAGFKWFLVFYIAIWPVRYPQHSRAMADNCICSPADQPGKNRGCQGKGLTFLHRFHPTIPIDVIRMATALWYSIPGPRRAEA